MLCAQLSGWINVILPEKHVFLGEKLTNFDLFITQICYGKN